MNDDQRELINAFNDGQLDELQASSGQQIDGLQRDIKNKDLIISQRDGQLAELTTESFDTPDGKVLSVNARTGTAYINLGSADGLRRQGGPWKDLRIVATASHY